MHTAEDYSAETDVQEFLDRSILKIIVEHDPNTTIDNVLWAVNTLDQLFGENALIPHDNAYEGIAKRFSLQALEGILVGIARNKEKITGTGDPNTFVSEKVEAFWREKDVADLSVPGLRGTTRIQRTVPFGETWFCPDE